MDEKWTDEEQAHAEASAQDAPEASPPQELPAEASGDPAGEAAAEGEGETPDNAGAGEAPANEADAPLLTVTVDGEGRALTPQEIPPLVESGIRWEAFRDSYEKLEQLAALAGKDVSALIDEIAKSSARAQLGRQEQVQQRLADEYMELAREFPGQFRAFGDVPKNVVEAALTQGISLYDAYLRHQRSEAKKAADAKARQAQAASQSAGSLKSDPVSTAPEIEAFLQGFNRSLR